jgi:hypothetical protein
VKDKADLLESFLGALYIDKDLQYCEVFAQVYLPSVRILVLYLPFTSPESSIADPNPESGAFLTPGSGMGEKSRSGSESGMNILEHISESLETMFWVKILKFFDACSDPGSGNLFDPGWKKFGSEIHIPDPQHCQKESDLSKYFIWQVP